MIEVANVTKIHARGETKVAALSDVSCQFATGSFTFVVGPSGSGKSTLLHLIGALEIPTSGEIKIDERSLTEFDSRQRNEYRRKEIGFVFQNFNLISNLNALDNVLVPFLPKGVTTGQRQQASDLLDQVGLAKRHEHRPHQLSGGEQQRVAIARAILKNPTLILADEPTGELDSKTGQEVFGYLRKLHSEKGTTVIVVTHDERYFLDTDRIVRLEDGRVVDSSSKGD